MYPNFKHIRFSQLEINRIQVLLGIHATQYVLETDFLQGPKNTPFEVRNLLGWTKTRPIKFSHQEQQRNNLLSFSYETFYREMNLTRNEEDPLEAYITSF